MTGKRNPKQMNGVVGVKILITAASLTAFVGGWKALAGQSKADLAEATVEPLIEESEQDVVQALNLAPIPTLFPERGGSTSNYNRLTAALPNAGVPNLSPVNGLPLVTPSAPINGNKKVDLDKDGNKQTGKTSKEPVANTRSS